VKIYVAMKALKKRERQDETQMYHKNTQFLRVSTPLPPLMLTCFFLQALFLNLIPIYDQTQGSSAVFSLLYE